MGREWQKRGEILDSNKFFADAAQGVTVKTAGRERRQPAQGAADFWEAVGERECTTQRQWPLAMLASHWLAARAASTTVGRSLSRRLRLAVRVAPRPSPLPRKRNLLTRLASRAAPHHFIFGVLRVSRY